MIRKGHDGHLLASKRPYYQGVLGLSWFDKVCPTRFDIARLVTSYKTSMAEGVLMPYAQLNVVVK